VVRGLASGNGVEAMTVGSVATRDVQAVGPDDRVGRAVSLMSEQAIRRLPVVDGGSLVGVVSIGDLAIERDPESALAEISQAPPNN